MELANDGWNYLSDGVYPEHGQHVIVWDMRDNVFDVNQKLVTGGDCWFIDKKVYWDKRPLNDRMRWNNSFDKYLECNGTRYLWEGQGPCSFSKVVAWRPFPQKPSRLE